jgi:hypothetical protein
MLILSETLAEGGCIFYVDAVRVITRNCLKCCMGDLKNITNITK